MKQRIQSNRKHSNIRSVKSKDNNRQQIKLSINHYKNKLFKVKHIKNSNLYAEESNVGGHYVLPVSIKPNTNDIGVVIITSIDKLDIEKNKERHVRDGLIMPINVQGLKRRSGIRNKVLTKNVINNKNINYNMLEEPKTEMILISPNIETIDDFLYNNPKHLKTSKSNRTNTKNHIKK